MWGKRTTILLICAAFWLGTGLCAREITPCDEGLCKDNPLNLESVDKHKHCKLKPDWGRGKHEFRSPEGLFIQERASKGLPGPGQHASFGAVVPWEEIHQQLDTGSNYKLLLLIRHGEAVSNWLEHTIGVDDWYKVVRGCEHDYNGTDWGIFDAELTDLGLSQADELNRMLAGGGWYDTITGKRPTRALTSPLSRCVTTTKIVFKDIELKNVHVEETCRETLGTDTCDARRSATDEGGDGKDRCGPCKFKDGLKEKFGPDIAFPVLGEDKNGFGLFSDEDKLWTKHKRESQPKQVKRARFFLRTVFDHSPEKVVFVVTHSGFTRSLLLAVGREPYRPQNAELVPVLVERRERRHKDADNDDDDDDKYNIFED